MTALTTKTLRTQPIAAAALRSMRPSYVPSVPATPAKISPVSALDGIGTAVKFAAGKTICEEGAAAEYVYKVVSGAVRKVRLLPDGRRHITSFVLAGDLFGFKDGAEYHDAVEAITEVTLVRYSQSAFERLMQSDSRLMRHVFGLICQKFSATQERLVLLGRKAALERIATFLLGMADGKTYPRAEIDLPMNRADIADYLGLTVETVSRNLTQLRERHIIDMPTANRIVLLKRGQLEDISAGEAG